MASLSIRQYGRLLIGRGLPRFDSGWPTLAWRVLLVAALGGAMLLGSAVLLAFGPRAFGYSSFVVYGGSMEPAIPVGSVVVAQPVSVESLRQGDVVAYRLAGSKAPPVLHRIVNMTDAKGVRTFSLKGDANETADPKDAVLEGVGSKVLYAVPYLGYFADFVQGRLGRALVVWLPALAVAALALWEIWAPHAGHGEGAGQWRAGPSGYGPR